MIDRIFAYQDVPCHCEVAPPGGVSFRADIVKISKSKAVLDTTVDLAKDTSVEVVLALPDVEPLRFGAVVVDAGENGLFLRWQHPDKKSAARLQTLLVECAGRPRTAPPPASGESVPADLRSSILKRTRTVRSADLAARQENVHVLGMTTIASLVHEAVAEAVAASERAFDDDERRRLLSEAEGALQQRLESLTAEKAGIEAQAKNLSRQLERAQSLLESEKRRVLSANQFTVSDAGILELEQRLGRLFERAVAGGAIDAEAEKEMRAVVARLLDEERAKIKENARQAQSDAIDLLERKVGRLAQALEASQAERDKAERYARALEAAGGAGSFLKNLYAAGLSDDDPDREKKLHLLKELVEVNKEVRAHMVVAGTLPAGGAQARPGGREFDKEEDEVAEEFA